MGYRVHLETRENLLIYLWARALAQRVRVEIHPLPAKAGTPIMYSISAIFEADSETIWICAG